MRAVHGRLMASLATTFIPLNPTDYMPAQPEMNTFVSLSSREEHVKRILLSATLALFAAPLFAQTNYPLFQIFGSYSHTSNFDVGQNGWLGSATYNLNRWFGVEGDLSGEYGSKSLGTTAAILNLVPDKVNSRMHNFDAGPRVTYRANKYTAFGHLLFGASHTNISATGASQSDTSFSWVLGGGANYFFMPHFGAQVQLDALRTNFFNHGDTHPRFAIGVTYRFGGDLSQ